MHTFGKSSYKKVTKGDNKSEPGIIIVLYLYFDFKKVLHIFVTKQCRNNLVESHHFLTTVDLNMCIFEE